MSSTTVGNTTRYQRPASWRRTLTLATQNRRMRGHSGTRKSEQFTYLLAVAAEGRPCHLEWQLSRRPTAATAVAATDVVHRRPSSVSVPVYHTHTHTHVVTNGVRGVGDGASAAAVTTAAAPDKSDTQVIQYTGGAPESLHTTARISMALGTSDAHTHAQNTHANTNSHKHTLSVASARSRTRTHTVGRAHAHRRRFHTHPHARTLPDRTPHVVRHPAAPQSLRIARATARHGVGVLSARRRGTERFPESEDITLAVVKCKRHSAMTQY